MTRDPAIRQRQIERVRRADGPGGTFERTLDRDTLVAEAPLELRIAGRSFAVIMRTPGHDAELARGLLFAEGAVAAGAEFEARIPDGLPDETRGNVLDLVTARPIELPARSLVSNSSCGVCGRTTIADLEERLAVCDGDLRAAAAEIAALPDRLRAAQAVFESTGGLHAAAAFDASGALLCLREDVGRHNAVDKVVGWALGQGRVPCHDTVLCISGRIGFEIVQKAVSAGFPIVVAVSAPSSLAVDLAERFRITLCGFTRDNRFNIYSHGSRVVTG